jgi:hypothetical protein
MNGSVPFAAIERVDSPRALAEWLKRAAPGQKCCYFTGAALPPAWREATAPAIAGGAVLPFQQRRADRRLDYCLVKRRNAGSAGPPAARGAVRRSNGHSGARTVDEEAEWLMAVLRRLAAEGRACPDNAALAELAVLKDAEAVRYRLRLLADGGRIKVGEVNGRRVITIIATGWSTAS